MQYTTKNIIQASDLKQKLETLDIHKTDSTIISLDIDKMYPSITFQMVHRAVSFFATTLSNEDKDTIAKCLKLIKFGMSNTLLTFQGRYYEYRGMSHDSTQCGLTIGGYESAWLADLVASFIFVQTDDLFQSTCRYSGIYRDDGIAIFNGLWKDEDITRWFQTFQYRVENCLKSKNLKFTCEIWRLGKHDTKVNTYLSDAITVIESKYFPYLDLDMYFSIMGKLRFRVHLKPNQTLKYLNQESTHTKSCIRAVRQGVFNRLVKLTSTTRSTLSSRMNTLYPDHCRALAVAGLLPDEVPTMNEVMRENDGKKPSSNPKKSKSRPNAKRQTFFCVGMSHVWKGKNSLPVKLKELRNKHELKWLRLSMSYHRFPNLRETIQGDLTVKLNDNIISSDFRDRPCNCCSKLKPNGQCIYKGNCRKSITIYKATCHDGHYYIGSTQQHLKARMNGHFGEVRDKINHNAPADTFASYCADKLTAEEENRRVKVGDARNLVKSVDILWQGNPISTVKSFHSLTCRLCSKERLFIHKARLKEDASDGPSKLLNSCSEIYGACRHIPRFHRYQRYDPSTDEG